MQENQTLGGASARGRHQPRTARPPFADRVDAGRQLAEQLAHLRDEDVVVLGLPRGGVPVAAEVAASLGAPLDVIVVRKLGLPFQPELAMGATAEGGARVLDTDLIARARVTANELRAVEERERDQLESRVARLRRGRRRVDLHDRTVVVVDDGIATGATARVACTVARQLGAARVILAVPVAPADAVGHLPEADELVCVAKPRRFLAVGSFYRDFTPTTDEEVVVLLDEAARRMVDERAAGNPPVCDVEVEIQAEIRSLARPLAGVSDLDALVHATGDARTVCIGEASHGTHEYYWWRAQLSRRLIEEHGFTWIGVEGDWPDCWRLTAGCVAWATKTSTPMSCLPGSSAGRPGCGRTGRSPSSSPGCACTTPRPRRSGRWGSTGSTCTPCGTRCA